MDFKNWLLNEISSKFELKIDPQIQSFALKMKDGRPIPETDLSKLHAFSKEALKNYFGGDLSNAAARYVFYLREIRDAYEVRLRFDVIPKGGTPEVSTPDNNVMHDFDVKHRGGMTGWNVYKNHKEALEEIPNNPALGYRGMSWEEWQYIRKKGHIQSKGTHNLGEIQEKLTFYGSADTAVYYSNGFAPLGYQSSQKRPSVVIAVSKDNLKDHNDHPGIPQSELAHIGPLSANEIVGVWFMIPTRSKKGSLELVFRWVPEKEDHWDGTYVLGKQTEGSRSTPSIGIAIKKIV